ncbi:uncharacterized protein [Choristoneura fumiferana]|uniref:uncharacterized protein n=1 Tax=Choristoneura fumiferana TaxID=7141 RepID=UPI003D15859E
MCVNAPPPAPGAPVPAQSCLTSPRTNSLIIINPFLYCYQLHFRQVKRDTRRMTPVPDEVGGAGRPPSAGPGRTLWKTHGRGAPWHGPSNKCTSRTAIGFSDK